MTDTLNARLAVSEQNGGAWQHSYTRNDHLGAARRTFGRLILDWNPTDRLNVQFDASGGIDKSDTEAARYVTTIPRLPGVLPLGLLNYPRPPSDPGAADWDPGVNFRRNDSQYFLSATVNYDVTSDILLKTIASIQQFDTKPVVDGDGTSYQNFTIADSGQIKDDYVEMRLESQGQDALKWLVGVNYDRNTTAENGHVEWRNASYPHYFPAYPITNASVPTFQTHESYAAYGSVTWTPIPSVDVQSGIRFTQLNQKFRGCSADGGDGVGSMLTEYLTFLFTGQHVHIPPGGCTTLNSSNFPAEAKLKFDQNNVSWKEGITWRFADDQMVYATVSKGYKGGTFPNIGADHDFEYAPSNQKICRGL